MRLRSALTFRETKPYNEIGDPVCLTGVDEPVGRVIRVRRARTGGWNVSIKLDENYALQTPGNAAVVRRWRGFGTCKVARGSKWDKQFDWRGRFLEIECPPIFVFWQSPDPSPCDLASAPSIKEHAVLASFVDCCGGIAELIPETRWQRIIHRGISFVEMDIGMIWIEVAGALLLVFGVIAILIHCTLRKLRRHRTVARHG